MPDDSPSSARGVGQPASAAIVWMSSPACRLPDRFSDRAASRSPLTRGVGHEPQPLPDVRSTEARSAKIDRPAGVTRAFQVSLNNGEPTEAVLARNLCAKDTLEAALADEMEPGGPKVPLVSKPSAFACRAERLARAGAGPRRTLVAPSGPAKGMGPHADAGEEVALRVSGEVRRLDVDDRTLVDVARRDMAGCDEVAEPLRGIGIDLVVVGPGGLRREIESMEPRAGRPEVSRRRRRQRRHTLDVLHDTGPDEPRRCARPGDRRSGRLLSCEVLTRAPGVSPPVASSWTRLLRRPFRGVAEIHEQFGFRRPRPPAPRPSRSRPTTWSARDVCGRHTSRRPSRASRHRCRSVAARRSP